MKRVRSGLDQLKDLGASAGARVGGHAQGLDRRSLLIGGGLGAGLLIAWGVWPRQYQPNLAVARNERLFNAFLKIDTVGQIIVVVPQLEMGQGDTTVLPQILADELGADWRTLAVQWAPVNPLYANTQLASQWMAGDWTRLAGGAGDWALREYARRNAMMLTGNGTAAQMFTAAYREAGAAARVLLCKAAAARWGVEWESCDIENGLVTDGRQKLRIGELADDAVNFALPEYLPERQGRENRLIGRNVPRLDMPSKIDGSYNYAADIRLPGMVYASIRQGPVGARELLRWNEKGAQAVPGFLRLVRQPGWVAAIAQNWWAANRALDALDPAFAVADPQLSSQSVGKALEAALKGDGGNRLIDIGDVDEAFEDNALIHAEFSVAPALHLAIEPPCATAHVTEERAEVWCATQAQNFCRAAVARALGRAETDVVIHPVGAGGSFDRRYEHDVAVQAALVARELGKPVQLQWSRLEEVIRDRPRPPARARLSARLSRSGMVEGWRARIAAPSAQAETWERIAHHRDEGAAMAAAGSQSLLAVSGASPPYAIPNIAVEHVGTAIGLPTGAWRGNSDSYTAFFTECFIDELAHQARMEPMSFRIQMMGGNARLAHCLTTAAAQGGWQGGVAGSGQGIACHMMDGSFIAVLAEVGLEKGRLMVNRIVCAADCGDQPHPDIARQQIEGGLIFGLAAAMGGDARYKAAMPTRALMGRMGLPRLADIGEVSLDLIGSDKAAGGVGQIGVPAIAPAVANALFTITGTRYRTLPLALPGHS